MSIQCEVLISCFPKWMTVKLTVAQSCPTLCDHLDCSPWNSPGQNTGVGSHSLLQGILPTQGSNPGLPHCRQNLYQLSHRRSPRGLKKFQDPLPFLSKVQLDSLNNTYTYLFIIYLVWTILLVLLHKFKMFS